jgi:3-oxoacyl-[acyl-carrier protein] reductase
MSVKFDFARKSAVVTGGLRGLGRSIADALAACNAEVHVFERDISGIEPGDFAVHAVDVADSESVAAAIKSMASPPLLLVNNAGITRDKSLMKMSDAEWRSVIDVNLTGSFNMIRALAPGMTAAGYGRIVNISSINGIRGKFGQANYSASKAGVIALAKTAARELGPKGVTVNVIAPGMVLTEMTLALAEEFRQKAMDESVLKRLAEPQDIANAVMFLLSDAARMITGQVIKVDSGQYI